MITQALMVLLAVTQQAPEARPVPAQPRVELRLGRGVVNREINDTDETYFATETVYAWMEITGATFGHVEHVWLRDGKEVSRYSLTIGAPRAFRAWSRHRAQAGNYTVEVRTPDGRVLARKAFHVFEEEDDSGC